MIRQSTIQSTTNFQLDRFKLPVAPDPSSEIDSPAVSTAPAESRPRSTGDAPFTTVGRCITVGVHMTVLVGLITFVMYQLYRTATLDRRRALVTVVASNLQQVTSPVDGVFITARHLPKCTHVKRGEILGRIVSPAHQAKLERTQAQLAQLLDHRWRQRSEMSRHRPPTGLDEASLGLEDKIKATKVELKQLEKLSDQLCVKAPYSGYVEHGLNGSFQVTCNGPIVFLWQEDDQLLVEVKAPLDLIHKLVRKGSFRTEFATTQGNISAMVVPITRSLKPISKENGSKSVELWGLIQCQPSSLPTSIAFPGAIGRL